MSKLTATPMPTRSPHGRHIVQPPIAELGDAAKQHFVGAALTMSWQLAVVVLVPIIGGVELGKALGAKEAGIFIGLAVAFIGAVAVMWRAMQAANRMPVPKLAPSQKRAIQKSYEEEDEDE